MEAAVSSGSASWTVHTDVFDGPLDLLLYLVKRDGVDVRKLDVRRVTDSYLAYLERMRDLNLSLAGDYLVMAATLVHLKSMELLPRLPTVLEEEEDPRDALARQLQEYERLRQAADFLDEQPRVGRDVYVRDPAVIDGSARIESGLDIFALLDLYANLLSARDAPEPIVSMVGDSGPDFRSCCEWVLRRLGGVGGRGELSQMLQSLHTRAERVVAFVAGLEMIKQHWLSVSQTGHLAAIDLVQLVDEDRIDLNNLTTWVEDGDSTPEDENGPLDD
ncbi:MAG: segregation/condensation protein A [Rhodobacterales bacterium]|nr:segregation/condensation protein A [Rhodobacterales bacterium]